MVPSNEVQTLISSSTIKDNIQGSPNVPRVAKVSLCTPMMVE